MNSKDRVARATLKKILLKLDKHQMKLFLEFSSTAGQVAKLLSAHKILETYGVS